MPNRKSVSGSLSHIMKVCENLKSAVQRWRVALLINNIGDLSVVFRCIAAGKILVLQWSSIILQCLYTLMKWQLQSQLGSWIFFWHGLLLGTVWDKSYSVMVGWGCPLHSYESLSLLGEGSSSLKNWSHCLILRRSHIINPEWWPSSGSGIYEWLLLLGVVLSFTLFMIFKEYGECG